jgi:hypothetical protein
VEQEDELAARIRQRAAKIEETKREQAANPSHWRSRDKKQQQQEQESEKGDGNLPSVPVFPQTEAPPACNLRTANMAKAAETPYPASERRPPPAAVAPSDDKENNGQGQQVPPPVVEPQPEPPRKPQPKAKKDKANRSGKKAKVGAILDAEASHVLKAVEIKLANPERELKLTTTGVAPT